MATSARPPNERRYGLSKEIAVDATFYRMGWLLGLAVGALTAYYRYAA
ncbi:MAG: hypothetical protein P0120_08840 [Nitrospira sp.]|nr:hypothetical protein [Nitrospira sp.]